MRRPIIGIAIVAAAAALLWCADPGRSEVWNFDSLTQIGGHAVTVEGHPRVISTLAGKAVSWVNWLIIPCTRSPWPGSRHTG